MQTVFARFGLRNWSRSARERFWLLAVSIALSLASHVIFLRVLPTPWQRNESADFRVFYEPVARQLALGHGFYLPNGKPALKYPPGIPAVYGGMFWLADHAALPRQIGFRALQGLLTVAAAAMIAMVAFEIFGARVALLACFFWSTYPFHLWLSKQPSGEPLICILLAAAVLAFLRWSSHGRAAALWGSICGIVVALAVLTKPFNIALAAVFIVLAWVCDVQCTRVKRALFSASLVIAFALTILPWGVWACRAAGRFIPLCTNDTASLIDGLTFGVGRNRIQNHPILPAQVEEVSNDFVAHRRDFRSNGEVLELLLVHTKQSPSHVALLFLTKAMGSWYGNDSHHHERWAALIQLFYIPFFVLGAWLTRAGGRQYRNFLLVACGITLYYWAMTTFVALPIVRYMLPAISLLMVFAAYALDMLVEACGWRPVLVKQEVTAQ